VELFYDFLFILGIILCLSYIFILNKNNKEIELPHKILISILVIFIFIFLSSYAIINNFGVISVFTIPIVLSAKNIIPTLLFFYIKSLFFEKKHILEGHRTILIFPILFLIIFIIPSILLEIVYSLLTLFNYYEGLQKAYETILLYRRSLTSIRIISNIVAIIYLVISLNYFFKLKDIIKSSYSYIVGNNFIWIRYLLIFPLLIIFIDSIFVFLEHYFFLNRWQNTEIFTSCILVMSILGMGYFGLKQTKMFVPYFLLEESNNDIVDSQSKTSTIESNVEFKNLEEKLKNTFETKKLFLNPDLTLGKLAEATGSTDKKISALLNQHLKVSFYEFVNGYRIEAFKGALKNNQYSDYTIEAISYECGFKSKASFYRVFKSKMNMSPSEYKNSIS